jgi:RNA polymerase sigma factor (sigma-70 family)
MFPAGLMKKAFAHTDDVKEQRRLESRSEDSKLIRAALRGKQEAFQRLMDKYRDAIYHLLRRMISSSDEIDDLTQETFIKAFASLKSFNEDYAFSTWLYKIATNNCIDYIRKKKLQTYSIDKPIESVESDFSFELPDTTYEPDRDIIQRQRSTLIEEAIASLPEKYRRVIILRHTEEKDYAEIAKILHLPIGTVKAHLFRAREMLNKYLREKIRHY